MTVFGPSFRVPTSRCPWCAYGIEGATGFADKAPRPGDLSMCVNCGRVLAFQEDLTVRRASRQEARAAMRKRPDLFEAWKQMKAERRRLN